METASYRLDCWYAAAWDTEAKRALLPRTIGKKKRNDDVSLQRAIEEQPDHIVHNLKIDAGATWARKLIGRLIAAERPVPSIGAAE